MNSLTVIQASQGLARYVVQHVPDAAAKGVVIGHDTRHNSEQFAHLVANAFAAMNVKIWWYGDYVPTPLVSFGLRHLGAAAGVMITASHVSNDCSFVERPMLIDTRTQRKIMVRAKGVFLDSS